MLTFKNIYKTCFLVLSFVFFSCKEEANKSIKVDEISFSKEGSLVIYETDKVSQKASFDIEFAESDYETQTGLMYRKGMKENEAMLFIFPNEAMHSFYMKNTQFALDIIYIDKDLKIASLQENAEPYNEDGLSSKVPIKYVLEVNGGLAQAKNIRIGDSISFTRQ